MAEFCTCGSIIIGGSCTNKSCGAKTSKKAGGAVLADGSIQKKERKSTRSKRASKCITYNLYENTDPSGVE